MHVVIIISMLVRLFVCFVVARRIFLFFLWKLKIIFLTCCKLEHILLIIFIYYILYIAERRISHVSAIGFPSPEFLLLAPRKNRLQNIQLVVGSSSYCYLFGKIFFFPTVSTIFFSTQKIFEIMGKTFFFHYYYFFYIFFLLWSSKIYGDGKLNHQEKEIGKKLIFVFFSFQGWVKKSSVFTSLFSSFS